MSLHAFFSAFIIVVAVVLHRKKQQQNDVKFFIIFYDNLQKKIKQTDRQICYQKKKETTRKTHKYCAKSVKSILCFHFNAAKKGQKE